ncbi:MlaD family protein, partial [Lacibacter sp.]|uniref:MlaD family protein n=1 Tax=Lacibacter sp. TaxID=1915409 RepID=UPI002B4B7090
MDTTSQSYKIKLGLFILGGILLFAVVLFIIGKKNNLFTPVFTISSTFNNVSGLQVGNNIRFSGITIGTVDDITIINDST